MQGSARKDVVFGAAGVYPVTVPGPKWKSWLYSVPVTDLPLNGYVVLANRSFFEQTDQPRPLTLLPTAVKKIALFCSA